MPTLTRRRRFWLPHAHTFHLKSVSEGSRSGSNRKHVSGFTALVNALVKISAHVLHTPAGLLSSYTLHVAMPPTREVYVLTNASSDSSPFSPHGSLLGYLHEAAMVVDGEKELAIN